MIKLDDSFFDGLQQIDWFASVGTPLPHVDFAVQAVMDEEDALRQLASDLWVDVKTEAQGDLTGYLAKHHPQDYGTVWNPLVKAATARLQATVLVDLQEAVHRRAWHASVTQHVMLDLTRAGLEHAYRQRFAKAPLFFGRLISIYEKGHLPCGWSGDLGDWPVGELLAY